MQYMHWLKHRQDIQPCPSPHRHLTDE